MGRQKLTAPFPAHIKPAREGWYLVRFPMGWSMKWWNGRVWRTSPGGFAILRQGRPWRGLTQPTRGRA